MSFQQSPRDVCTFYRTNAEHKLAIQTFVREGDRRGARLLIAADAYPADAYPSEVYPADIYPPDVYPPNTYPQDIIKSTELTPADIRPALSFYTRKGQVLQLAQGSPEPKDLPALKSVARAEGFRELWLAVDGAQTELVQAAVDLNMTVLSLYNAASIPGNDLMAALQRHPFVLAAGEIGENDHYLPPLASDDPHGDARFSACYRRLLERRSIPQSELLPEAFITDLVTDAMALVLVPPDQEPRLVDMKGNIAGYSPVEIYQLQNPEEIVFVEDRPLLLDFIQSLMQNESAEIDLRLNISGGSEKMWARIVGRGLCPPGQATHYIYLAARDIDWRKRTEIELADSYTALSKMVERLDQANRQLLNQKRQLDLLVRQAPMLIWTTDLELNIISMIGSYSQIQPGSEKLPEGRSLESLMGKSSPVISAHQAAMQGETQSYQVEFGGRQFLAQVEPLRQPDGVITGVVGVGLDVTERLQSEAVLQLAQAYNRSLLDASLDALILLDINGTILALNETAAKYLNRSTDGLVGGQLTDLLPPDLGQQVLNNLSSVITSHKTVEETLDINASILRARLDPIIDPQGRVAQVSLLVQDITPYLNAERDERNRREVSEMLRSVSEDLSRVIHRREVFDVVLLGLRWLIPEFSVHFWTIKDDEARIEAFYQHPTVRGLTDLARFPAMPVSTLYYLTKMVETQQPVLLGDVSDDPKWIRFPQTNWIRSYAGAPIVMGKVVTGGIILVCEQPNAITPQHVEILQSLAAQTAIALQKVQIFTNLEEKNQALAEAYGELASKNWALTAAYDATIAGWARALELRDKETEGHSQRVVALTMRLANWLEIPEAEQRYLRWGALLHDIGKMAVPDHILLKADKPLTEEEWAVMKMHPSMAYQMLEGIEYLKPALEIPSSHHEWWNGSGYPQGLQGEEIPMAARLFSVIDAYDALTNPRPYRPAWQVERAIEHIRSLAGQQFDPRMVEAFLNMMGFNS